MAVSGDLEALNSQNFPRAEHLPQAPRDVNPALTGRVWGEGQGGQLVMSTILQSFT
jgi:hypothetical protein